LSTLRIEWDGAVVRLTLDRPEKRNAIDEPTRVVLAETLAGLDRDATVRVVVLTGAGTAFCTGSDLSGVAPAARPDPNRPRLVAPVEQFSKPIIAAINGTAVGGGLELALACDLRIASTVARFGLPEVRIGSLPGSGGTQRLPRAVGPALAAQMLFTGEMISAERALSAGLVSELCAPDELLDRAMALAASIAANAPRSLIAAKQALRAALESAAGFDLERNLFNALSITEDRQEGRAAFRERRPPQFKGK
jgi:E-phenylitaconyl-CoA hydratase